ncbi:creatininase family protein [Patescibacteria group bacterium]|nr:creatininase family protein [Patescibacteria group bacterium]
MKASYLSTTEIAKYRDTVALLPFGSFEQHGPYLPLLTDTAIAEGLAERIEQRLPKEVMLFPALWTGASREHRGFPGTLSLPAELLIQQLQELFTWLEASGWRKGVVYNAHGGNIHLAAVACEEYSRPHQLRVKSMYAYTAKVKAVAKQQFGVSDTHAGSTEASLLFTLRPDLAPAVAELPNDHPVVTAGALAYKETREIAENGVLHPFPTVEINREKGGILADCMIEEAARVIREW